MKRTALLLVAVVLAAVAGCSAVLFVGAAAPGQAATCSLAEVGDDTTAAAAAAATGNAAASDPGSLPASIGSYRGEQVTNAGQVILAARDLGLGAQAQAIGVMTAIGESHLINVDHGDAAGPDSRGILQQRDNGAWGSYVDRMTPRIAARNFFTALAKVPSWQTMAPTLAAHAVQGNADPYHYEPYWADAVRIVAVLSGDPDLASKLPAAGDVACAAGSVGTVTGAGAALDNTSCSVVPDPTTGRGCLTPRMLNVAQQLIAQGWSLSCWDPHPQNPQSSHPQGKACDVFPGAGGVLPTAAQKATGDALAASVQATASQTGITYIIWYGRIWSLARNSEGWRTYNGGGHYDPGSITGGHFDHLHLDVG